ncbi:AraC family transcriptional regulator [Lachnospiraceae bacterium 54-53]
MQQFNYSFSKNTINLKQYIYKIGSYHYNWHKELEILVVLNGEAEVCVDGVSRTLKAGDVILINSNMGHATLARKTDSIAMVLHVDPDFFKDYYDNIEYLSFDCCSGKDTGKDKPFILIKAYLSEMILNCSKSTPERKLLFESAFFHLLHTIVLYFPPKVIQTTAYMNLKNTFEAIDKMVRYIDRNFKKKITLDDLAKVSQYNRNYISQFFKTYLGINFYDYLTRIRLREATLELGRTDKIISDIALSNGFSEIKAFNSAFKSKFGKTPTEYRKQLNSDITKNDISFKKVFLPSDDEDVNKILMQYVADKNSYYLDSSHRDVQLNYKNTVESVHLMSEMSMKLKGVARELKQTTDGLEKIIWTLSE